MGLREQIPLLAACSGLGEEAGPAGGDGDLATEGCVSADLGSAEGSPVAERPNIPGRNDVDGDCADETGNDLSFRWTVPETGAWMIDTHGSEYDTILGLYLGDCADLGGLVACNDDNEGGSGNWSRIDVEADQGAVYVIVVDAFQAGDGGTSVLNIDQLW